MAISLAQGLFMAEAEGYFLSKDEKFKRELEYQIDRCNGIVPESVILNLLDKYDMTLDDLNNFLSKHNAKIIVTFQK